MNKRVKLEKNKIGEKIKMESKENMVEKYINQGMRFQTKL